MDMFYCADVDTGGGGKGTKGASAPGGTVLGRHLEEKTYGTLKFYTPNLAYCSQSTIMPSV